MILQVDIGSSRIKWRLLDNQNSMAARSQPTSTILSGEPLVWQGIASVTEVLAVSLANLTVLASVLYVRLLTDQANVSD